MPINEATISRVKYPPELLPEAVFNNIPAGAEVAPPILDLRRISGRLLRLSDIAVERNPNVELRIRNDDMGLPDAYNVAGGFFDLTSDIYTGTHTAVGHATIMTDAAAHFVAGALVGLAMFNVTDGSSGVITGNTVNTVTVAALAGGAANTWATGDTYTIPSPVSPYANNFQMLARDRLYYNLFNSSAALIPDFRTSFGIWVDNLRVVDKLKLGIVLDSNERALAEKYGIIDTVEKGLLPLPLEQQIEREYRSQLISEETHGRTMDVTATSQVVETMYPRTGQFLVLTKLAATAGTPANNIRISISRDNDADYIPNLKPYAVGLERELSCFIPAMSELTLNIIAAGAVTVYIRYTIWKVKLSNLLRCRFGLMSRDEAPGDIFDKVAGGIL